MSAGKHCLKLFSCKLEYPNMGREHQFARVCIWKDNTEIIPILEIAAYAYSLCAKSQHMLTFNLKLY